MLAVLVSLIARPTTHFLPLAKVDGDDVVTLPGGLRMILWLGSGETVVRPGLKTAPILPFETGGATVAARVDEEFAFPEGVDGYLALDALAQIRFRWRRGATRFEYAPAALPAPAGWTGERKIPIKMGRLNVTAPLSVAGEARPVPLAFNAPFLFLEGAKPSGKIPVTSRGQREVLETGVLRDVRLGPLVWPWRVSAAYAPTGSANVAMPLDDLGADLVVALADGTITLLSKPEDPARRVLGDLLFAGGLEVDGADVRLETLTLVRVGGRPVEEVLGLIRDGGAEFERLAETMASPEASFEAEEYGVYRRDDEAVWQPVGGGRASKPAPVRVSGRRDGGGRSRSLGPR